jgi:hypothetical protein
LDWPLASPPWFVIDRAGRLRFRHTGFLGAENFDGNLSRLLERLLREGSGCAGLLS